MARTDGGTIVTGRLGNGLAVACRRVPGPVECCGVAIMAGSRDENDTEHGLAHFVEHTIFKGTHRRRSHHVINRMETVGGELNAYTTKEETYVYTVAPAHNTARAIELIADLVVNCNFPAAELDKEREVVCDEISSYLDAPDAAVYDDFEDLIFADSTLGHNILGTRRSVARLDRDHCRRWVERFYNSGRMVFFYTGPATERRVMDLAARYLGCVPAGEPCAGRGLLPPVEPFDKLRLIRSHQAHTVMGARLDGNLSRYHDALSLLNNILGGPGMNSLLNVSLREDRGLVYTVDSSLTRYSGTMLWTVYFGCDDEHTALCRSLVAEALGRMASEPLSQRAMSMARRQLLGQMTLSRAGVENTALALGRCMLRGDTYRTAAQLAADFEVVTPDDLCGAARMIASAGLSALTFH